MKANSSSLIASRGNRSQRQSVHILVHCCLTRSWSTKRNLCDPCKASTLVNLICLAPFLIMSSSISIHAHIALEYNNNSVNVEKTHICWSQWLQLAKAIQHIKDYRLYCRPPCVSHSIFYRERSFISRTGIKLNFFFHLTCPWSLSFFMRQNKCWFSTVCKGKQLKVITGVSRTLGQPVLIEG